MTFNGTSLPILSQSSTALEAAVPVGAGDGDCPAYADCHWHLANQRAGSDCRHHQRHEPRRLREQGNRRIQLAVAAIISETSTAIKVAIPTGLATGYFHVLVNDTGMNTPTFTVTP